MGHFFQSSVRDSLVFQGLRLHLLDPTLTDSMRTLYIKIFGIIRLFCTVQFFAENIYLVAD